MMMYNRWKVELHGWTPFVIHDNIGNNVGDDVGNGYDVSHDVGDVIYGKWYLKNIYNEFPSLFKSLNIYLNGFQQDVVICHSHIKTTWW